MKVVAVSWTSAGKVNLATEKLPDTRITHKNILNVLTEITSF